MSKITEEKNITKIAIWGIGGFIASWAVSRLAVTCIDEIFISKFNYSLFENNSGYNTTANFIMFVLVVSMIIISISVCKNINNNKELSE
ncbi:hypothetical protein CHL78_006345 [Romboutsia weinsteinii]|uniref:Uncharacterized protein n=1 Tax=Romboutsia weinsteinii TaxID=2020949 RepID=A0A371J644_9FIRM|nr:hypothetical protein [Romboutsia weinsteinii]RDY28204.1 hypothetical protein CHL78_006345 [Romboutsia weinsteinii]